MEDGEHPRMLAKNEKEDGEWKHCNEGSTDVCLHEWELQRIRGDATQGAVELGAEPQSQLRTFLLVREGGVRDVVLRERRQFDDHPPRTARSRA